MRKEEGKEGKSDEGKEEDLLRRKVMTCKDGYDGALTNSHWSDYQKSKKKFFHSLSNVLNVCWEVESSFCDIWCLWKK